MGRKVRGWTQACVGAALTLGAAGAPAQSQDLQKGLNQLFRAMQSQGGGAPAAAGAGAAGGLDSSQNVEAVVKDARERKRISGSTMSSESWCQAAANPFIPEKMQGSGWMELVAKCTVVLEEDEKNRARAVEARELRRADTERAQKTQARQESEDYEARRQSLLAGLKSGTIQPKNCAVDGRSRAGSARASND